MDKKLNPKELQTFIKKPGRHADGGGLYFRTLGLGRAYWVYRYRIDGREREMSLGAYPETSLAEARDLLDDERAKVKKGIDPLAKAASAKGVPTFGQQADAYLASHEATWRSPKHRGQWRMTLTQYCEAIRDTPVDKVDAKAVLRVLEPLWAKVPETASRLRARIEAVLASAQVAGHIDPDRPNPARWKGWLDQKLPNPKKIGARGNHAAMPYADLPAFMARLSGTPGTPAQALTFTVLTAARSGETLGATWDEIDLDAATWMIPASRMKMGKAHDVPLSDAAVAVLRGLGGKGDGYVFPGARPRRPLGVNAMAHALLALGGEAGGTATWTIHGMRASFRMWAADTGVAFEVAEACLAHTVGSAAAQAYQRSSMLERRRPVMKAWAAFLTGESDAKVVSIGSRRERP